MSPAYGKLLAVTAVTSGTAINTSPAPPEIHENLSQVLFHPVAS